MTASVPGTLRQSAPRRRRPTAKADSLFSIFEDTAGASLTAPPSRPDTTNHRTSSIAGEAAPPKKPASHGPRNGSVTLRAADDKSAKPHRSARLSSLTNTTVQEMARNDGPVLKKNPRRRTMWIPSDDTTVMTIHPGNHDDQNTTSSVFREVENPENVTALDHGPSQPRRAPRRSSLAQAPRRGTALQPTLRPVQESDIVVDREGARTGKENLPPGYLEIGDKREKANKSSASQIVLKKRTSMLPPLALGEGSGNSSNISRKRDLSSPGEPPADRKPRPSTVGLRRLSSASVQSKVKPRSANVQEQAPTSLYKPRFSAAPVKKYPLIYENIEQPAMFEESWLGNQESAIVELLNRLFASFNPTSATTTNSSLRQRLLKVYQDKPMLLLYQRLQASLQFGALSLPKERESSSDAARYVNDVGLRRQFVRLWMTSYNPKALRAAVEVVTGRQVTVDHDRTLTTTDLDDFIVSCLLRNEDASEVAQRLPGSKGVAWNWRRTMQRGLMLINLLDVAKEQNLFHKNLFKTSSAHKSSATILNDFTSIMLPWGGDIVRPLGHLDYHITHVQQPLSEFDYTITNLAVDLRDGVRLVRLVELLLYPMTAQRRLSDDQTISMPMGEVLDTSESTDKMSILSQHLKYPCASHACKTYNSQIALSALLTVRSIADVAAKTTANDIVDGHRENTIALLWALVSKWGMTSLIDWDDVRSELVRITPGAVHASLPSKDLAAPSARAQRHLLKDWAVAISAKHGTTIDNMTTSFANGIIFERIVDEYQAFLGTSNANVDGSGLEQKLKSLGCSNAFASIFGKTSSFFDEEFTYTTLYFLASRLLGPSKTMRERRKALKALAEDCAVIVQTREKVTNAATVLQRAWREHYAWRLSRFDKGEVDIWLA
jgi:abnormal spindle-like microcephaly-associated protein